MFYCDNIQNLNNCADLGVKFATTQSSRAAIINAVENRYLPVLWLKTKFVSITKLLSISKKYVINSHNLQKSTHVIECRLFNSNSGFDFVVTWSYLNMLIELRVGKHRNTVPQATSALTKFKFEQYNWLVFCTHVTNIGVTNDNVFKIYNNYGRNI